MHILIGKTDLSNKDLSTIQYRLEMKSQTYLAALTLFVIIQACRTSGVTSQVAADDVTLYEQAVLDAMAPSPKDVYNGLVAIAPTNKELIRTNIKGEEYILVVTWKNDTSYYKPNASGFYNTGNYQIWVTTAPELKNRMRSEGSNNVDLRLKQLLGLPPEAEYRYFIEFWVKSSDLFRPCPDNEINDESCDLCFPNDTDNHYITWFNESRIDRYYDCELGNKYPWTQLGYTYDWHPGNESHIGLSEFVIDKNKNIIVNEIYSTTEYLK